VSREAVEGCVAEQVEKWLRKTTDSFASGPTTGVVPLIPIAPEVVGARRIEHADHHVGRSRLGEECAPRHLADCQRRERRRGAPLRTAGEEERRDEERQRGGQMQPS
jgi:hypothetical protein